MSPFSLEAKRWGFKKEGTRLTAETTATKWLSVDPGSEISHRLEHLEDKGLRGVKAAYPSHSGVKVTDGKATAPVRTSHFGEFLNMLLGAPTSAEQACVVVSAGVNDKIDLKEDSDAAVAVTLTPGSYIVGATSAVAGSFCKLVKDQLEAANGASTYTVAYDATTRLFTITKSAGVFILQWATGTNAATSAKALLGFGAADTASAIAATSTSAVGNHVYKHTFLLPSSVQPPTYTFFIDRSLGVKKYNGVAVKKLALKSTADGFVQFEADLLGLDEAAGDIGSPVYTDEAIPLTFQHVDVKLGGASMTNVKDWSLSLDSGLFAKRVMSGSQVAVDVLAPGQMKIEGSLTVYFEDETERAKFIANTTNTLQFLVQGDVLSGATKEALDINLYKIAYKAFPYSDLDGMLGAQATFEAVFSATDGKMVQADLTNKVASY